MATTYEAIATVTVGSGGASNIEFTSIPATYTDLALKISTRCATDDFPNIRIRFNGVTTNYSHRILFGSGSSAGSYSGTNNGIDYTSDDAAAQTANTFSNSEIYIPNYAGSSNKSVSADGVSENNATAAYALLTAGLWSNTSAINTIRLYYGGGQNLAQYSTATLYGIKNS
jgi:hypothetical protein